MDLIIILACVAIASGLYRKYRLNQALGRRRMEIEQQRRRNTGSVDS